VHVDPVDDHVAHVLQREARAARDVHLHCCCKSFEKSQYFAIFSTY
jgi:hypothetical protein